jgi:hypothetical protein
MVRQRVRTRTSPFVLVGRAVMVLLELALIWGGIAVVLLALKVDAGAVDSIIGYRSVYDHLTGIGASDFGGSTRALTAAAGILALVLFGFAARKAIPSPYLARHGLSLEQGDRGDVVVGPRAVERLAEVSALQEWAVMSASGRYGGDDVTVNVTLRRTAEPAEVLRQVQTRIHAAVGEHGLPAVPVNVTLSGYKQKTGRELN